MKIKDTQILGVRILEPEIHFDERGFFYESYNKKKLDQWLSENICFVQDNHSHSTKGVLRGLHYQTPPYAQGKLVRCTVGEVYDVAVDLRKSSPTFGKWTGVYLSEDNKKQLWIPAGCAHGFLTLSDIADVLYKTTNYYNKDSEAYLKWNDKSIGIKWPIQNMEITLSTKDSSAKTLEESPLFL